jgi:large subunit ribosomal protein L49
MLELVANKKKTAIQYPYFVPRNSNGAVPVYSDFKNQRSRNLTLIRNVEGNVQVRSN